MRVPPAFSVRLPTETSSLGGRHPSLRLQL